METTFGKGFHFTRGSLGVGGILSYSQEQAERDVVIWADALKNVQPYLIDITMDIILDQPEQMLFALLRSALNSTKPVSEILFTDISPALWQACYRLACTQGVMALAWDGIQTLPACLQPPKALKLNWAMAVENYENATCGTAIP